MSPVPVVEHFVLFQAKDGIPTAAVDAWLSGLRSLSSLSLVAHLSASPVLRCRSSPGGAPTFTHILHCRFRTRADLAGYAVHPAHLSVVRELGAPVCDDILAVDWVSNVDSDEVALKGEYSVRVMLVRLREGAGDSEKADVLATLGRIRSSTADVQRASCGHNFSPGRAQGFSVGSMWVSRGLEEFNLLDLAESEVMERVSPSVESIIVTDFVVSDVSFSSSVNPTLP